MELVKKVRLAMYMKWAGIGGLLLSVVAVFYCLMIGQYYWIILCLFAIFLSLQLIINSLKVTREVHRGI